MKRESGREAPRRYLGLELAGAKNDKTALAALEYYPREKKIFLLDIYDRISGHDHQSGDEALLEIIDELRTSAPGGVAKLGVNVPLTLPPCITCVRQTCLLPGLKCAVPAVKWMRTQAKKASKGERHPHRIEQITPYTQRPVELWLRHFVRPAFEVDEALGGNKAPLTARMGFLKRHLAGLVLSEVSPKLSTARLSAGMGMSKRTTATYRHLEEGAHSRSEFLETLTHTHGVFIYERDLRKLAQSLPAFDAFICAYTALLSDNGQCVKPPAGFPVASGWVDFPA